MKILATILFLFFSASRLNAQQNMLTTGDKVPDIELKNIRNFNSETLKLSYLKNRLIILDFWATWCGSCLGSLPKLEKLQEEFGDKILIVLVNTESEGKVDSFLQQRKKIAGTMLNLPRLQIDSMMKTLFSVPSLPHYIWIDENRIIKAITSSDELTEENILAMLNNQQAEIKGKSNKKIPWDYKRPLFSSGNGGNGENIQWHSVLSGYVEGLPGGTWVSNDNANGHTILAMNLPVKELYQLAFNYDDKPELMSLCLPDSRTILQVKDTFRYVASINSVWQNENTFTYQLIAPPVPYLALKKAMQEDLVRYFGLHAKLLKRKMECMVLTVKDTLKLFTNGGSEDILETPYTGLVMKNLSVGWLVRTLSEYTGKLPIIDETRFKGKMDLNIRANLNDIEELKQALTLYGINFKKEIRDIDVLILSDH